MTEMEILKPCPFCGGQAIRPAFQENLPRTRGQIECSECATQAHVTVWNTRHEAAKGAEQHDNPLRNHLASCPICFTPNCTTPHRFAEQPIPTICVQCGLTVVKDGFCKCVAGIQTAEQVQLGSKLNVSEQPVGMLGYQAKQTCEYCKAYPNRIGGGCSICTPKPEPSQPDALPESGVLSMTAERILELFWGAQVAFDHGNDVEHMLKFGEATDCMTNYFHQKANGGLPERESGQGDKP